MDISEFDHEAQSILSFPEQGWKVTARSGLMPYNRRLRAGVTTTFSTQPHAARMTISAAPNLSTVWKETEAEAKVSFTPEGRTSAELSVERKNHSFSVTTEDLSKPVSLCDAVVTHSAVLGRNVRTREEFNIPKQSAQTSFSYRAAPGLHFGTIVDASRKDPINVKMALRGDLYSGWSFVIAPVFNNRREGRFQFDGFGLSVVGGVSFSRKVAMKVAVQAENVRIPHLRRDELKLSAGLEIPCTGCDSQMLLRVKVDQDLSPALAISRMLGEWRTTVSVARREGWKVGLCFSQ